MRRRASRQGGFTLIEVMIALAILAIGLVALMRSSATNISMAQRAQMLTAATNLARGKMYDLEERLLTDGYQELDIVEEGNFAEEGWPAITWKAEIVKIELPDMATLQNLGGAPGQGEAGAVAGDAGPAAPTGVDPAAAEGGGGGMLEMFGLGGDMGEGGGAGAGMMGTYYSLVSDVLKEAIRKATLTISYPIVGGEIESFVVTCYFTDPAAVNRKVPQAAGQGEEEEDGTETPGTGQEGTGGQGGGTGQEGTGGRGMGSGAGGTSGQGTGGRGTGGTGPGRGGTTR